MKNLNDSINDLRYSINVTKEMLMHILNLEIEDKKYNRAMKNFLKAKKKNDFNSMTIYKQKCEMIDEHMDEMIEYIERIKHNMDSYLSDRKV